MEIHTLRIWFKSFIPSDLEGLERVPGIGEHAGKTMLASPAPFRACFLTDQRTFSTDIYASARTHSQIEIDARTGALLRQHHHCNDTIQVDCGNGTQTCKEAGDNSAMQFTDYTVSEQGRRISVELQGAARNPCFEVAGIKLSPNLDYDGTLTITLDQARERATIGFEGHIESYPAFEMYVSANDGPAQTLFQYPVVVGSTPIDLAGGPRRQIRDAITITA